MSRSVAVLAGLAGLAIAGVIVLAAMGRPIPDLLTYVATTTVGGAAGAAAPSSSHARDRAREAGRPARHAHVDVEDLADEPAPAAAAAGPPWHGKQRMRGPQ